MKLVPKKKFCQQSKYNKSYNALDKTIYKHKFPLELTNMEQQY